MLQTDTTALLVVDFQEKLLPSIHEAEQCLDAARRLIQACEKLGLPQLVTEQYPRGLGRTVESIRGVLDGLKPVEKTRFSACVSDVVQQLQELARPYIVIVGIEAHVCVQQTVLELLKLGFTPCVCVDGISSRRSLDKEISLQRMAQAGAVLTTTESVIFELLGEAGTDAFKEILKIIK
jgi:nicotinamidase-related amidase